MIEFFDTVFTFNAEGVFENAKFWFNNNLFSK